MTTFDRDVEAGARSDAVFDGRPWDSLGRADKARYLARTRAALLAALPVVGEDLVAAINTAQEAVHDDISASACAEAVLRRIAEILSDAGKGEG